VAWQYKGSQYSNLMGSFRILSDGSRTVGWGVHSGTLAFTEVDAKGNDLLDLSFIPVSWSYRAIKVPLDQLDLQVLRNTAGLP
jgi:hypothetical protein